MCTLRWNSILVVTTLVVGFCFVGCNGDGGGGGDGGGNGGSKAAGGNVAKGLELAKATCINSLCHMPNSMTKAPLLGPAVQTRVRAMGEYETYIEKLKVTQKANYEAAKSDIDAILAKQGDERLELWFRAYLAKPTFDDPEQRMPPLTTPLTDQQMDDVVAYLMSLK